MFCVFFLLLQAFQRQVQECLTQLELINKQYRRLARENRTDSSCRLREMVHDGNRRWDNLQKRVAAIIRRLKVASFENCGILKSLLPFELVPFLFFVHVLNYKETPKSVKDHENMQKNIKRGCLSVTALHQSEGGVRDCTRQHPCVAD